MHKRTMNAIATAVTGAVAAGALATGLAVSAGAGTVRSAASPLGAVSTSASAASPDGKGVSSLVASETFNIPGKKHHGRKASEESTSAPSDEPSGDLPSGTATATSFWDPGTASGQPMSYQTLASPYWPLGTKVRVTVDGQSAIGVVEDFGPAEWAVAQHSPPAIIDLSEEMMADLTGSRDNSVTAEFEVLSFGDGDVYRHGGTGYDLAMGGG